MSNKKTSRVIEIMPKEGVIDVRRRRKPGEKNGELIARYILGRMVALDKPEPIKRRPKAKYD